MSSLDRGQRSVRVAVIALLCVAGLAFAATGRERSLAIYPSQRLPIVFDHALHLEAGADCASCHDRARKSVTSSDVLLPGHDTDSRGKARYHEECEACHDIDGAAKGKRVDPKSGCSDCHLHFDPTVAKEVNRVELPAPNLIFDHKIHVDRKVDCKSCHTDMKGVGLATRQQLPKMETCLICHQGTFASAACATCHPTQPSGRLQLSFASGVMRPMQGNPLGLDHGPRFEFNHGTRAALNRGMCMSCHAETECASCHNSMQKPLSVHPNDYITLHPVQARMDSTKCDSCHRMQSFCAACHERAGVGMDADPSLRARNVRVHPDWQTWVNDPGPFHHSVQASRDIKQCIACHREESCMACHSTQGVNANSRATSPHPDGFKTMCKSLVAKNDRACLKCHQATDWSRAGYCL